MATAQDHALVRHLRSIFPLSDTDAEVVAAMPMTARTFASDQDIVRQGDHPAHTCLVVAGVAAMYKITGPGRRQILNFYFPGDVPDLHSIHLSTMDSAIGTLTRSTLGFISHDVIRDVCRRHPTLGDAFWKMTLVDSSVFREWIVNVGQRDAFMRLAHLLCEIYVRMQVVGRVKEQSCDLPITRKSSPTRPESRWCMSTGCCGICGDRD